LDTQVREARAVRDAAAQELSRAERGASPAHSAAGSAAADSKRRSGLGSMSPRSPIRGLGGASSISSIASSPDSPARSRSSPTLSARKTARHALMAEREALAAVLESDAAVAAADDAEKFSQSPVRPPGSAVVGSSECTATTATTASAAVRTMALDLCALVGALVEERIDNNDDTASSSTSGSESEARVDRLEAELARTAESLAEARAACEHERAQVDALRDANAREIESFASDLDALHVAHANEIGSILASHSASLEALTTSFAADIDDLSQFHAKESKRAHLAHIAETDALRALANEADALAARRDADVETVHRAIRLVKAAYRDIRAELTRLRATTADSLDLPLTAAAGQSEPQPKPQSKPQSKPLPVPQVEDRVATNPSQSAESLVAVVREIRGVLSRGNPLEAGDEDLALQIAALAREAREHADTWVDDAAVGKAVRFELADDDTVEPVTPAASSPSTRRRRPDNLAHADVDDGQDPETYVDYFSFQFSIFFSFSHSF
jgi:hypothetical protein